MMVIQGEIKCRENWLRMKLERLREMSFENLTGLQFFNAEYYTRLGSPNCVTIKEVSYIRNIHLQNAPQVNVDDAEFKRKERVEQLKKSLLLPEELTAKKESNKKAESTFTKSSF